jgi:hypothetical protein
MVEIIEINDIQSLSPYRLLWNSLFAATPNGTFFHTYDWLESYWRHFGERQKLRVLIAYAAGEALGILPLCVRRERHRLGTLRVLTYPLDQGGVWYGPIGPNPSATMMAAMQHIRRTPRDWELLELRYVPDEGTQGGKYARALRAANMFTEKREHCSNLVVDLDATANRVAEGLPHQHLANAWQLLENGRIRYVRHRPAPASEGDGEPRWDLFAHLESMVISFQEVAQARVNYFDLHQARNFLRDAHAAASRLGMADLNLLSIDGCPTAFLYGYHCRGNVHVLLNVHDASFSTLYLHLLQQLINDSCRRGDRKIYLAAWGYMTSLPPFRNETTYRLTYTPLNSWRSQALRWTRWAKSRWSKSTDPATLPKAI